MQDQSDDVQRPRGAPCEISGEQPEWEITRRSFVKSAGAVAGAAAIGWPVVRANASPLHDPARPVKLLPLKLKINGELKEVSIDPRISLLDLLRENLKLTGTKKGCDHGQCGACTVLAGGRRINSCLSLAIVHDGDEITTVEGLGTPEALHPVQQAFLDNDGFQCGYCTPGQICSTVALLSEVKDGTPSQQTSNLGRPAAIELTDEEIRERMSGNICRCGAYPGIVAAVRQAYGKA